MTERVVDDRQWMRRALALARRGWGQVSPNPLVGAVVVRDHVAVGEGWHARFGDAHAEPVALAQAGEAARGATLYVTLEPCAHHGKQPPCVDAILASGIARVVVAARDPNPVASGGVERLRAHGVQVDVGVCARAARAMNAPFFFALQHTDRPYITLKLACTIDGAIADHARTRGWFTGDASRRAVHALRASADAIAVGRDTVLIDDPALTVREGYAPRVAPARVVVARHGRVPATSQLVRTAREVPVWVLGAPPADERASLEARGVTVLPAASLAEGLTALRARGVHHLMVEGGATLAGALLDEGMVDRLVIFRAPLVLGAGALPAFAGLHGRTLATAVRLRPRVRRRLGDDLLEIYSVTRR
ncbi:MAG: bifunctional diaminohydroxyphosphoribosylaminopyrimidine deaminase/5-amino-6-(5-phosphoribosylamino)uracil reductase RibD [Gemmatimonadaceae bacterium]|jgi:diaminohydroxyphosphoribosylaminopyrimidine deaminase/5-amino-6-(5-phosphoribosylamino)uracil reductase|nr:bifunctional diaminohydroxyphosphoribosylaminopyrimidine deaminase/5-amino-6-(5-phosphoribosylamino)uracil reductase RibD [Gemmatimonadaceae bacterium]